MHFVVYDYYLSISHSKITGGTEGLTPMTTTRGASASC